MNAQILLDAIGGIRDPLIEEASRPPRRIAKWSGIAAGIAAVLTAGALWMNQSALPMLTIEEGSSAMGFEGYIAYDISELSTGNPWTAETALTTLPVYENPLARDENPAGTDEKFRRMEACLRELAKRLGADPEKLEITDNTPDAAYQEAVREKFASVGEEVPEGYFDPTCLIAQWDGIEIQLDFSMTAEISFEPALALPEGYAYRHGSSYEETTAAGEWLAEQYASLLNMEDPQLCISGGDYDIYRQQGYTVEVYDDAGDSLERMLNWNFRRVSFYCDDDGKLFLIRMRNPDLTEKFGDYPILTAEEAADLLADGQYATSVPAEFPGEEWIARTELLYRSGSGEKVWMPWYRFLVELPEMAQEDGAKTYGAYYVPAVEGRYIANMPKWDGSFL